ncbi:PREDICTED: uncharacterized protein LOC109114828 [Nelumbo nucifera]|uniref:Cotton fiber protein n=2 Tax=Nelumbo nucifera TaxID=4432 RepID=A0A822Y7Z0_NELNU|nr:PREDICTED: uncharacterized protein LOC109114828 [Nelumbo nucifera]DAD27691.1 TPA_asm: hypothetical protein HUJ06_029159 [Nelumbo nucifera]
MVFDNWKPLNRLRTAVKKVRFLLNYNVNRFRLASIIGKPSGHRRLSFNDRPGLRVITDDTDSEDSGSARGLQGLQRTISFPSEEDVDSRAEMFISNFYRRLQIERQISLELQYCRENSLESTRSD